MSSSEPKPLHRLLRRESMPPEPEPLLNLPLLRESISIPADEPDTTKHKQTPGHRSRSSRSTSSIGGGRHHGHNDGSAEERWRRGTSGDGAGRAKDTDDGTSELWISGGSFPSPSPPLPAPDRPRRRDLSLSVDSSHLLFSSLLLPTQWQPPRAHAVAAATSLSAHAGFGQRGGPGSGVPKPGHAAVAEKLEERSCNFESIIPASEGSSPLLFS